MKNVAEKPRCPKRGRELRSTANSLSKFNIYAMVTDKRSFEFQWRDRFYCYTLNERAESSAFSLFSNGEII